MRRLFLKSMLASLLVVFGMSTVAFASSPEIYQNKKWTHALNGYDAVAYFSLEKGADPVAGSDDFVTTYKGATWRFASADNLEKFKADPASYVPQYGGYCAWAMARDKLAKGDPTVWYVRGGKLYLNVSRGIQKKWLKNIDRDIANADKNFPGILDRK